MIQITNVSGSIAPLNFTIEVSHTENRKWSAYDKTKLDSSFVKLYPNLNDYSRMQLAQKGEILCSGELSGERVRGSFIGELSVGLNETIPQIVFVEGTLTGELVSDTFVATLQGQVFNCTECLGEVTGSLQLQVVGTNISTGLVNLSISYEDWERALLSPTTASVSDSKYHAKRSTSTAAYWWRESLDKQLLLARDEILNEKHSQYYKTATPNSIRAQYLSLLSLEKRTSITRSQFIRIWNAYQDLIRHGPTSLGYSLAFSRFSAQAPSVSTLEHNSWVVGEALVKIGGELSRNTFLIDYSNTELEVPFQVLEWFTRLVKNKEKKTVIRTQKQAKVII